jgi:hypothetical protein
MSQDNSPPRSSSDRSLAARIAAAERWGRAKDRSAETLPARTGLLRKFEREADPDGDLSPQELERRVASLMQAHMLRMSLAAKRARQERGSQVGTSR